MASLPQKYTLSPARNLMQVDSVGVVHLDEMKWAEVALQNQVMGVDFLPRSAASRDHDSSPANNKPAKSVVMMENA